MSTRRSHDALFWLTVAVAPPLAYVGWRAWQKRKLTELQRQPDASPDRARGTTSAASHAASSSSSPAPSPKGSTRNNVPTYTPASWAPLVAQLITTDFPRIPPRFAMAWLALESGGNPCSFGRPQDKGPDGQPRELGLGQIYNPDDLKRLGVDAAAFRAYCQMGTQTVTRALTFDEMRAQVLHTLLREIDHCIDLADRTMRRYQLRWQGFAYWALVKAPHALPALMGRGMPAVVGVLQRAPRTWREFRTVLGMDAQNADGTYKHLQWVRALHACEACAEAVAPEREAA
jgi:hypothetical protein